MNKQFLFGSRANGHFHKNSDFDFYDLEKNFDKFQKNLQEHKLVELEIYCRYFPEISKMFNNFKFDKSKLFEYVEIKNQEDTKRFIKYFENDEQSNYKNSLFQLYKNKIMNMKIQQFFENKIDSLNFDLEVKMYLSEIYENIQNDVLNQIPSQILKLL